MKYNVHRFKIDMDYDRDKLEKFLNELKGEVVSIIPHNARSSILQIFGWSRKVDFLFIIEKI